jgi:hypothetical protein
MPVLGARVLERTLSPESLAMRQLFVGSGLAQPGAGGWQSPSEAPSSGRTGGGVQISAEIWPLGCADAGASWGADQHLAPGHSSVSSPRATFHGPDWSSVGVLLKNLRRSAGRGVPLLQLGELHEGGGRDAGRAGQHGVPPSAVEPTGESEASVERPTAAAKNSWRGSWTLKALLSPRRKPPAICVHCDAAADSGGGRGSFSPLGKCPPKSMSDMWHVMSTCMPKPCAWSAHQTSAGAGCE